MPLSWNEIRDRAIAFSRKYHEEKSERAEAQSFLNDFFNVFGVERKRVGVFERHAKRIDGSTGRIDLFWPGMILVEMKSRGEDLEEAFQQALDYLHNIKGPEHPRYILVSDFERFILTDLDPDVREDMFEDAEKEFEFKLKDFHKNIKLFGSLAGYTVETYTEQNPADIEAAGLMGKLHDELKEVGYKGHELEVFLVRLLFCLFADDTGIFPVTKPFQRFIRQRTSEDGSDLALWLNEIFAVLNQDRSKRFKTIDSQLDELPYVNGKLFTEQIRTAPFTHKMRKQLLECCDFDWSEISPAIFGALFQSIMDRDARRNIGAHYTSEKNILKLIKPLFLDNLWNEYHKVKKTAGALAAFHKKLRELTFLDPACGCGNFLVITYRELRRLELKVIEAIGKLEGSNPDQISMNLLSVDVDQFYGIEIDEWPAQIAQVAMWLVDHQMNTKASLKFGQPFARIPLTTSATIVNDNAINDKAIPLDWGNVVQKDKLSYILGNPPFVGSKFLNDSQKNDTLSAFKGMNGGGTLDYVCAWYVKAAKFIKGTKIVAAFVSTNSVSQGEQAGILWSELLKLGMKIHFAHRTFQWSNEAKGKAAVHCVIIGFANFDISHKTIFDYSDIRGEAHAIEAKNINPYLADAPDVLLLRRSSPICDVPAMKFGNQPIDGGHLILDEEERRDLVRREPAAKSFIRPFLGSEEYINGIKRYCLWLKNISPDELRRLPLVMGRVGLVKKFRLESKRPATRDLADTPSQFAFVSHDERPYVIVPSVSSERRPYIPIGFLKPQTIASNLCMIIPGAKLYHFGILNSQIHMAWVRYTCGRLKSDYRYSAGIVYNNFPWPESPTAKQKAAIEQAAQSVLDTRAKYLESSLADLYDPVTIPPDLVKAHQKLDKAVDAAYGKRTPFATEAERVAYLFELYQKLTEPLMAGEKKKRKPKISAK